MENEPSELEYKFDPPFEVMYENILYTIFGLSGLDFDANGNVEFDYFHTLDGVKMDRRITRTNKDLPVACHIIAECKQEYEKRQHIQIVNKLKQSQHINKYENQTTF